MRRGILAPSTPGRIARWRAWSTIAVMFLTSGAVVSAASPAAAAGGVSFSRDGVTWAPSLGDPLFDESIRWVPGDIRETTVLVRNDGGDDSALSIRVRSGAVDDLFRESALEVAVRTDDQGWQVSHRPGDHHLTDAELADGDISRITVRVAMPASVDSSAQRLQLDFEVLVTLAQESSAVSTDSGMLAETGGADLIPLTMGAIAVAAGGVFLAARQGSPRQERRPEGEGV